MEEALHSTAVSRVIFSSYTCRPIYLCKVNDFIDEGQLDDIVTV
jgi:hypothetical protein